MMVIIVIQVKRTRLIMGYVSSLQDQIVQEAVIQIYTLSLLGKTIVPTKSVSRDLYSNAILFEVVIIMTSLLKLTMMRA